MCDELDAVLLENLENLKPLEPLHVIGVTATCNAEDNDSKLSMEIAIFEHAGFLIVDERFKGLNASIPTCSMVAAHPGLSLDNMK